MLKALWLTSWYPNKLDMQNGDFIQRHARATSQYCQVHVIHLEPDVNNFIEAKTERTYHKIENLSETILLYKLSNSFSIISKIISFIRYLNLYKNEIKKYIAANGPPDIIHVHVPWKAGLLALWIKRKYNIPYLITEHWNIYKSLAIDEFSTRNYFFKYYTKKIFKNASFFLPVSTDLGRRVNQTVGNVNYEAVPNCVDTNQFFYSKEKKPAFFTFIHASTLNYPKNPEVLLKACMHFNKKYPDSRFLILGQVSTLLNDFIVKEEIDQNANIIFKGLVTYNDVANYMQQSSALFMFSRYENLPCVVLEALCCGIPIVSSRVGGIPEVVDEKNALLTQAYKIEDLLNAMEEMFIHYSRFKQEDIAQIARKQFSFSAVGKLIFEKYNKLVNP